jgi:hypothetical protein
VDIRTVLRTSQIKLRNITQKTVVQSILLYVGRPTHSYHRPSKPQATNISIMRTSGIVNTTGALLAGYFIGLIASRQGLGLSSFETTSSLQEIYTLGILTDTKTFQERLTILRVENENAVEKIKELEAKLKVPVDRLKENAFEKKVVAKKATDVPVDRLPGAFANNQIYLQGARVSTTYDNDDVHVDLFGFAGDWLTRARWKEPECKKDRDPYNDTLMTYGEMQHSVTLFLDRIVYSVDREPSSDSIPMTFIPIRSRDSNLEETNPIWRVNVTDYVQKSNLISQVSQDPKASLTFSLWMKYHSQAPVQIATLGIPLNTAVEGMGGPQIRGQGDSLSYFHQPQVPVSLCVATYRSKVIKFLPEFVQHHLNVGVGQIVIGVHGERYSSEMKVVQKLLASFIHDGSVVLAHYGLPQFGCNPDFMKMQFYNTCLYHNKGISKYSMSWDLDEYWIPPAMLENQPVQGNISSSPETSFLRGVTSDTTWQRSNYSKSLSIGDTLTAIDNHYEKHGCADDWCFHRFPSYNVHVLDAMWVRDDKRTNIVGDDFRKRDRKVDNVYDKSVANTKVAHSAGYHLAASCLFDPAVADKPEAYVPDTIKGKCRDVQKMDPSIFGSMHHFYTLATGPRGSRQNESMTVNDEYVTLFSKTIKDQLDSKGLLPKSNKA